VSFLLSLPFFVFFPMAWPSLFGFFVGWSLPLSISVFL
jgi:hypothetical protein